jgi:hypothetical protein
MFWLEKSDHFNLNNQIFYEIFVQIHQILKGGKNHQIMYQVAKTLEFRSDNTD